MVKKNCKGLTIIELLIVLGLISIIIALAFQFNIFAIKGLKIGQDNAQVQHNVRLASDFITRELRNAYTINILSELPEPLDEDRRYIYVDGNTIKHYQSGEVNDIMINPPPGMVPELLFDKNPNNFRILKYTISGLYNGKDFELTSEVHPSNLLSTEVINGTANIILEYSSPLTPEEIVMVDKLLLDLKKRNLFLVLESDGSLTSNPYPDPDTLLLLNYGPNGSFITWSSSDSTLINNNGVIIRPGIGAGNRSAQLTATMTFKDATSVKEFTLNIVDMDPLDIVLKTIPAATVGSEYTYFLQATGGNGFYTFTSDNLQYGLTIDATGKISGIPVEPDLGPAVYTFNVILSDTFSNSDSFLIYIPIN